MTITNITASMDNDRTTLVLVNQRENLRVLASRRWEEVWAAIAGTAMIVLLYQQVCLGAQAIRFLQALAQLVQFVEVGHHFFLFQ